MTGKGMTGTEGVGGREPLGLLDSSGSRCWPLCWGQLQREASESKQGSCNRRWKMRERGVTVRERKIKLSVRAVLVQWG
jgi:hypothetical protein